MSDRTPNGYAKHRWVVVGLSLLLVIVVMFVLGFRALGESARLDRSQTAQDSRIDDNLGQILAQVQGGCLFYQEIAHLPAVSPKPGVVLLQLADAARVAFLVEGCPNAINPRTNRPYGPLPVFPTPDR